ncbi:Hypothetical predicted protein, partial [Olea europaea subsp. europaea]
VMYIASPGLEAAKRLQTSIAPERRIITSNKPTAERRAAGHNKYHIVDLARSYPSQEGR